MYKITVKIGVKTVIEEYWACGFRSDIRVAALMASRINEKPEVIKKKIHFQDSSEELECDSFNIELLSKDDSTGNMRFKMTLSKDIFLLIDGVLIDKKEDDIEYGFITIDCSYNNSNGVSVHLGNIPADTLKQINRDVFEYLAER